MKKFQKPKKSKILKKRQFSVNTILLLNDGRLAIGLSMELLIYNMKTYKTDITLELRYAEEVKFFLQLKDNTLFYYTYDKSSEGPWSDEYFRNYLIELSDKNYVDKTKILPDKSKYNILREHSDNILFGGITYEKKTGSHHSTNASGPKRIEKLVKNTEEPEKNENKSDDKDNSNIKGKFSVTGSLNIDFEDFVLPDNNLIAVVTFDNLILYKSEDFTKINSTKISYGENIATFNDNLLLIGTGKNVIIFDYKNLKTVKNIFCVYPYKIFFVNKPRVFIGESDIIDNRITEYEIDNEGNYKQISDPLDTRKGQLNGIIVMKDGRIITSSNDDVRIWS